MKGFDMVNLQGDKAERFDVITELLEAFDLDVADAIDAAVYIIDGASADAKGWDAGYTDGWNDRIAAERYEAAVDEAEAMDSADEFDRQAELDAFAVAAGRDAAKAVHPSFSRGLDYSALADGHYDEQVSDEPEAVYINSRDWTLDYSLPDFTFGTERDDASGFLRLSDADVSRLGEFKPVSA